MEQIIPGAVVAFKYKLLSLLGHGSFGEVYEAINVLTKKHVAIKYPQLFYEYKVYCHIKSTRIPSIECYEQEGDYNFMVMERLGNSLENEATINPKFKQPEFVFSIAHQMITLVETLHSKQFIHRDIKPQNFCFSIQNPEVLYLIDFGLAKRFVQKSTGQHIEFKEHKQLVGTPRYASVNSHRGYEQSRRDDLESLGYVIIYLLKGMLPWMNVFSHSKEGKNELIQKIKEEISTVTLCSGLSYSLVKYFNYVKKLQFTELPDYEYLKKLLKEPQKAYDIDPQELEENIDIDIPTLLEQGMENNARLNLQLINGFSNEALAIDRSVDGDTVIQDGRTIEFSKPFVKQNTTYERVSEDTDIPSEHDRIIKHNLPSIMAYKNHDGFTKLNTLIDMKSHFNIIY